MTDTIPSVIEQPNQDDASLMGDTSASPTKQLHQDDVTGEFLLAFDLYAKIGEYENDIKHKSVQGDWLGAELLKNIVNDLKQSFSEASAEAQQFAKDKIKLQNKVSSLQEKLAAAEDELATLLNESIDTQSEAQLIGALTHLIHDLSAGNSLPIPNKSLIHGGKISATAVRENITKRFPEAQLKRSDILINQGLKEIETVL